MRKLTATLIAIVCLILLGASSHATAAEPRAIHLSATPTLQRYVTPRLDRLRQWTFEVWTKGHPIGGTWTLSSSCSGSGFAKHLAYHVNACSGNHEGQRFGVIRLTYIGSADFTFVWRQR